MGASTTRVDTDSWGLPGGILEPGESIAQPDQVETSQVAWMTPEEVLTLKTHPTLKKLNRAVVEHLEGGAFVL